MSWTLNDFVSWLPEGVAIAILVGAIGLYTAGFVDLLLGGIHYVVGSLLFGTLLVVTGRIDRPRFHKWGGKLGLRDWRNRLGFDDSEWPLNSGRIFRASAVVYFVTYAVATYLAMATPVRPTEYFGLVGVLFLIVGVQITAVAPRGTRQTVVLLELLATNLSLVYSLSLKYYLFYGDTDTLVHVWYVRYVVRSGSTIPIEGLYESFPLWHVLSAGLHLITDLGFQVWKSMFLLGGAVGLLAVLGSYALACRLFADRTTPLYCALLVAANPTVVFYSAYSIPRSVIGSFVPLYLLLLLNVSDNRRVGVLLGLFGATVVYHPASVPFLVPVFMAIAILLYYTGGELDPRWRTQLRLLGVFGIATVVYWVYQSPQLTQAIAGRVLALATGSAPPTTGSSSPSSGSGLVRTLSPEAGLLQIVDRLYFGPLLALLLVGARTVLRDRDRRRTASVVCAAVGLGFFFVAVPGPLSLISTLLEDFAFTRWWLYVYPLVLLICGVGLTWLRQNSHQTTGITVSVVLLLVLAPALSGYSVAPDNPIIETNRKEAYFTKAEVVAFEHVAEFNRGHVYADYHTNRYYEATPFDDDFRPLVYYHSTQRIDIGPTNLAVFRREAAKKRSIRVQNARGTEIRITASDLRGPLSRHNRVYTSGSVVIYD